MQPDSLFARIADGTRTFVQNLPQLLWRGYFSIQSQDGFLNNYSSACLW